jgi:hypothetical protein
VEIDAGQLADLLSREYGIAPTAIVDAPRGFVAATFDVRALDGRRYFVKVLPLWADAAALPAFIRDLGGDAAVYGLQGGVFWTGVVAASAILGLRPRGRVGSLYAAGLTLNAIGNLLVGLAQGAGWLVGAVLVPPADERTTSVGWPSATLPPGTIRPGSVRCAERTCPATTEFSAMQ